MRFISPQAWKEKKVIFFLKLPHTSRITLTAYNESLDFTNYQEKIFKRFCFKCYRTFQNVKAKYKYNFDLEIEQVQLRWSSHTLRIGKWGVGLVLNFKISVNPSVGLKLKINSDTSKYWSVKRPYRCDFRKSPNDALLFWNVKSNR